MFNLYSALKVKKRTGVAYSSLSSPVPANSHFLAFGYLSPIGFSRPFSGSSTPVCAAPVGDMQIVLNSFKTQIRLFHSSAQKSPMGLHLRVKAKVLKAAHKAPWDPIPNPLSHLNFVNCPLTHSDPATLTAQVSLNLLRTYFFEIQVYICILSLRLGHCSNVTTPIYGALSNPLFPLMVFKDDLSFLNLS